MKFNDTIRASSLAAAAATWNRLRGIHLRAARRHPRRGSPRRAIRLVEGNRAEALLGVEPGCREFSAAGT